MKIAIIGAGVNGLACAIRVQEQYKDFEVVLFSREFSPDTTGDGAGGLWLPYLCGATNADNITKWGSVTYKFLFDLWKKGDCNVCLMPLYHFCSNAATLTRPQWADAALGFEIFDSAQIKYFNNLYSYTYRSGFRLTTFVVHTTSFLEHLMRRFQNAGGKVVRAEVASLCDQLLEDFDVVINCSGLGARVIVPDDGVYPIRGQISKVIAPWMNQVLMDEERGNYIIPNAVTCVLGGTHQENDFNKEVDEGDKAFITNGCRALVPGLKHAELVMHWTGLRPARDQVRLEAEQRGTRLVIHNYGHGGSGFTLFWGCAENVLELLKENIQTRSLNKSKL